MQKSVIDVLDIRKLTNIQIYGNNKRQSALFKVSRRHRVFLSAKRCRAKGAGVVSKLCVQVVVALLSAARPCRPCVRDAVDLVHVVSSNVVDVTCRYGGGARQRLTMTLTTVAGWWTTKTAHEGPPTAQKALTRRRHLEP